MSGIGMEKGQRDFGRIWKELRSKIDLEKRRKWRESLKRIFGAEEPKKERCSVCKEEVDGLSR